MNFGAIIVVLLAVFASLTKEGVSGRGLRGAVVKPVEPVCRNCVSSSDFSGRKPASVQTLVDPFQGPRVLPSSAFQSDSTRTKRRGKQTVTKATVAHVASAPAPVPAQNATATPEPEQRNTNLRGPVATAPPQNATATPEPEQRNTNLRGPVATAPPQNATATPEPVERNTNLRGPVATAPPQNATATPEPVERNTTNLRGPVTTAPPQNATALAPEPVERKKPNLRGDRTCTSKVFLTDDEDAPANCPYQVPYGPMKEE